jgi:hypothetical protein
MTENDFWEKLKYFSRIARSRMRSPQANQLGLGTFRASPQDQSHRKIKLSKREIEILVIYMIDEDEKSN